MNDIFTLDFYKKTAIFQGHELPTGTLACEALNISKGEIAALMKPMKKMSLILARISLGLSVEKHVEGIRKAVFGMLNSLAETPPFHRLDIENLKAKADACLTTDTARRLLHNADKVSYNDARNGNLSPEDQKMLDFTDLIQKLSLIGLGLQTFRQKVLTLAEQCNTGLYAGTPADYALAYAESGGQKEQAMNDTLAVFSGVSCSYVYLAEPARIVRRIHFSNVASMLRTDFFEGLMMGHAPKKCSVCGRWFLTTDAHRAAYCDGFAPDDPKERTCRQVGARLGREKREKAENHPVKKIYQHTINAINQRYHRNTISEEAAAAARRLAKNYMEQALVDHGFASDEYKQKMQVDVLLSETML